METETTILDEKGQIIEGLENHFGHDAAEIIYSIHSAKFAKGEVFDKFKERSGLSNDEQVTAKMLAELDPSICFILGKGESEYDTTSALSVFSSDIQATLQELLDEHKQIKNDLSASGKATAGPQIDPKLHEWSDRFTKAQSASLGVAKAFFKANLPIPTYTFN